jgi:hypothetical protein
MSNKLSFSNAIDLPEELVPLLVHKTWACEYASIKRDGTPVTSPVITFPGEDGCTIDVNTGLTYPWKADRARNNPRVCLLYSEPDGTTVEKPPVVLVYGGATVHDADLQGNTDRYVHAVNTRVSMFSQMFRLMPSFMLQGMAGYLARIWIAITPIKILWWPGGDMDVSPKQWRAPDDIQIRPSDPPPEPLTNNHNPIIPSPNGWRKNLEHALDNLGTPILTVVDEEGYPVPFRVRNSSLHREGVDLELLSAMPTKVKGRSCLTFHTIQLKNGEAVSNENLSFIGDVSGDKVKAIFKIERQLTSASFKSGPKGWVLLSRVFRNGGRRLEVEASRRGQPVPVIRLIG